VPATGQCCEYTRNRTVTLSDTVNVTKRCRLQWKGQRLSGKFGIFRGT